MKNKCKDYKLINSFKNIANPISYFFSSVESILTNFYEKNFALLTFLKK